MVPPAIVQNEKPKNRSANPKWLKKIKRPLNKIRNSPTENVYLLKILI